MSDQVIQSQGARSQGNIEPGQTSSAPNGRSEGAPSVHAPRGNSGSPQQQLEQSTVGAQESARQLFQPRVGSPAGPAGGAVAPPPPAVQQARQPQHQREASHLVQQRSAQAPAGMPPAQDPNQLGSLPDGSFAFMEGLDRRVVPMQAALQLIEAGRATEAQASSPQYIEMKQNAQAMSDLRQMMAVSPERSQQLSSLVQAWQTGGVPNYAQPPVAAPAAAASLSDPADPYAAPAAPQPAQANQPDQAVAAQLAMLQQQMATLSQSEQHRLEVQAAASEENQMRADLAQYQHLAGDNSALLEHAVATAKAARAASPMEALGSIVRRVAAEEADHQRAVQDQLLGQYQPLAGMAPVLPASAGAPVTSATGPQSTRFDLQDGSISARAASRYEAMMSRLRASPLG